MTRRRMGAKFTMFPDAWDYQLAKIRADGCTYRVAIYLLRESWRVDNNRVKLPNGVLKERSPTNWCGYHSCCWCGYHTCSGAATVHTVPES